MTGTDIARTTGLLLVFAIPVVYLISTRGLARMDHIDRLNYLVFVAVAYPWLALSAFTDLPAWLDGACLAVAGASLVLFLVRAVMWVRTAGADLTRISEQSAAAMAQIRAARREQGIPDRNDPCGKTLLGRRHREHEWIPAGGVRTICRGYPEPADAPDRPAPF